MKTPNRHKRLKIGKDRLRSYSGKNPVKGYSKKFGVDKLRAAKELRILGLEITEEYEIQLKKSLEALKEQKQLRKEKKQNELNSLKKVDSDYFFAFIAGYTSGGFAYGITHEEMNKIDSDNVL